MWNLESCKQENQALSMLLKFETQINNQFLSFGKISFVIFLAILTGICYRFSYFH